MTCKTDAVQLPRRSPTNLPALFPFVGDLALAGECFTRMLPRCSLCIRSLDGEVLKQGKSRPRYTVRHRYIDVTDRDMRHARGQLPC